MTAGQGEGVIAAGDAGQRCLCWGVLNPPITSYTLGSWGAGRQHYRGGGGRGEGGIVFAGAGAGERAAMSSLGAGVGSQRKMQRDNLWREERHDEQRVERHDR